MKFLAFKKDDKTTEPAKPLLHPMVSFGVASDGRVVMYIREDDGKGTVWVSLHMGPDSCKQLIEDIAHFAGWVVEVK